MSSLPVYNNQSSKINFGNTLNNLENRKIKRNFKVKNSVDAYSRISPYGAD